jgi:hypothetical protein
MAWLGCSSERPAATQVVVLVESTDALAARLARIHVAVRGEGSETVVDETSFALRAGQSADKRASLPFSFGVEMRSARRFELQVSGYAAADSEPSVRYSTLVEFADGKTLLARVLLDDACEARSCPSGETCYFEDAAAAVRGACGPIVRASTQVIAPGTEQMFVREVRDTSDAGRADGGSRSDVDAGERNQGAGGRAAAGSAGRAQAGSAGSREPSAAEDDAGSDDVPADAGSADAGSAETAAVERELAGMIEKRNLAIDALCGCSQTAFAMSRRECENGTGGKINEGHARCMSAAMQADPEGAIPALNCKGATFQSFAECLAVNFDCSDPFTAQSCQDTFGLGTQRCATYPSTVQPLAAACDMLAESFANYVLFVQARTERICRCYMALGYANLGECQAAEGIVELQYDALETCFFEAERAVAGSVDVFLGCDQPQLMAYAQCMDAVNVCESSGAVACRNMFRIERAACIGQAQFVVNPFTLCAP